MTMLLLKNHLWAAFQQQLQYCMTTYIFHNIEKFYITAILWVYHNEQNK